MDSDYKLQIKKARKKIIRRYYKKCYPVTTIQVPDYFIEVLQKIYPDNPNYHSMVIGLYATAFKLVKPPGAISQATVDFWVVFVEKNKELMDKIHYEVYPKGSHRIKYTYAMQILLERGFVHIADVVPHFDKGLYSVYSNALPLVWPEQFEQHQDALQLMAKVGIPNFTTCPAILLQKALYNRIF